MTDPDTPLVLTHFKDGILTLTLNRPRQHNCLNQPLLDELLATVKVVRHDVRAVILKGAGKSFSTGGDLKAFLAHAETPETLEAFSSHLVGTLNEVILALLDLPVPVISAVHGPVTGGSLGFVLASDLSVMAPTAFAQPYYGRVGFGPDGGWTAMTPDRIGPDAAAGILAVNRRVDAAAAARMGLITRVSEHIEATVGRWCDMILEQERESLAANKALLWPTARKEALAAKLEAERQQFVALVGRPIVKERLEAFLNAIS
ncbi:enoyl-CoA hydratase/isomerase family protein [Kordiimonas marina]|uniref:enoyl-CoA hydratase/isomerase family protein n=1 Tax=Kordiimonas marina TaxID=2872312 RepID=UPI001FF427B7|nr:enoyl-CoA hydratase/isomerase family protein [Kordiimonas marina]MCJ9430137.1 enoyl-CoA hydratase/isomerase family protein [Kordiimonas marina]